MSASSIEILDIEDAKRFLIASALDSGFSRARIAAPFIPAEPGEARFQGKGYGDPALSALVVALPYGNEADGAGPAAADAESPVQEPAARLDVFSRRNYYAETVARLQRIAGAARGRFGGMRRDYRILCNSPVPEKPIAAACGLGTIGRNTLLITPEAGSLVVVGILTLPFAVPGDAPLDGPDPCAKCAACVKACPTGALGPMPEDPRAAASSASPAAENRGARSLDRTRCIQWHASRPGDIPEDIAAVWGDRLYGCSVCRDVCPANARRIRGAETERGALPASFDVRALAEASDAELSALFKGTALGMSWLGPAAIRRNAVLAAKGARKPRGEL